MSTKSTSHKPPIEVQNNARRALELRAKLPSSKRGLTTIGIARARDLAGGRPQSVDTLKRMVSFFARHEVDKQAENWKVGSKGWQAWMAWGGDAGRRWAERIVAANMADEPMEKDLAPTIPAPKPPTPMVPKPETPLASPKNDTGEGDGAMALGQLRALSDKTAQLTSRLTPETDLEPWVQSLITEAANAITSVYDYLMYSKSDGKDNDMEKTLSHGIALDDAIDIDVVNEESHPEEEKMAFAKFASFQKANADQRMVVGYASSERIDGQNDIVDSEALKGALDDYMQWANLREMHQPKAVGKVLSATPIKGQIQLKDGTVLTNPLRIIAKIVDEDAWQKVKAGILKGFSIGGKVKNAITQKVGGKDVRRITELVLNEISLVDRPANPDARIVMMKRDDSVMDKQSIEAHVKNGTPAADIIAKAKPADPSDILPQIQQLRNQAEIDGDLDTAERYNEVITLMLEAMGIIPTGTVREIEDIEGADLMGDLDLPEDMADIEDIYPDNKESAMKRRNAVMYADGADNDLKKIGRMISKNNMDTLSDIVRAAKIIVALTGKLGVKMEDGMQDDDAKPVASEAVIAVTEEPAEAPEKPEGLDIMTALANAPRKEMPGNNTGVPIHTDMSNPDAPRQNVKSGYPIMRSQESGDLQKSATADDAVDIAQIEKEMQSMESPIENATPETVAPESVEAVEKAEPTTTHTLDVSTALQDVIAKSLQGALAGTVAQLETVAKAVERIEAKNTEQTTAVWDALKPINDAITATKDMVTPLVEKVSTLETVAEQVKALGERMTAIENQPVDGKAILRGQMVEKSLGVGGDKPEEADEATRLEKMIDETHNPLVKTQLREQLAYLRTKQALFGGRS